MSARKSFSNGGGDSRSPARRNKNCAAPPSARTPPPSPVGEPPSPLFIRAQRYQLRHERKLRENEYLQITPNPPRVRRARRAPPAAPWWHLWTRFPSNAQSFVRTFFCFLVFIMLVILWSNPKGFWNVPPLNRRTTTTTTKTTIEKVETTTMMTTAPSLEALNDTGKSIIR